MLFSNDNGRFKKAYKSVENMNTMLALRGLLERRQNEQRHPPVVPDYQRYRRAFDVLNQIARDRAENQHPPAHKKLRAG